MNSQCFAQVGLINKYYSEGLLSISNYVGLVVTAYILIEKQSQREITE